MSKIFKIFKKKRKEKEQKPESGDMRQKDALGPPPVDYALWQAFSGSEPWSRQQYDDYCRSPAGAYFVAPSYEEYLRLFEERRDIARDSDNWSDYYSAHMW